MRKLTILALLLLAAAPLAAAPVDRGVDLWRTRGNGTTFIDFSANPIPAGFFCDGSPAFTGKVAFEGVPLETDIPGGLFGADTVVERLDDANFNRRGQATTRIQVRALSLSSVKPIATGCGLWSVLISLEGEQPTTHMRLVRTGANEGYFQAPLALNGKLTFVQLTGVGNREPLSLARPVEFKITPKIPWSVQPGIVDRQIDYVRVDTDGDREPDRLSSAAAASRPASAARPLPARPSPMAPSARSTSASCATSRTATATRGPLSSGAAPSRASPPRPRPPAPTSTAPSMPWSARSPSTTSRSTRTDRIPALRDRGRARDPGSASPLSRSLSRPHSSQQSLWPLEIGVGALVGGGSFFFHGKE